MLEQEMASIIRYVLDNAGGPAPYYWNVPQHFSVPAAYFPPPELTTGGETFLTYWTDSAWYIKLFHRTGQGAYSAGNAVVQAIRAARNLIPLIEQDGTVIAGEWVRVKDPKLKVLDDGAAQLTIGWRSRRPYNDTMEAVVPAQTFSLDVFMKSGKTISDAYAEALERYAIPTQDTGRQPE